VAGFLEDLGYVAVAPTLLPSFQYFREEKAGWASPWSERHVAYACGLGTFSLNDGFITSAKVITINNANIRRSPGHIVFNRQRILLDFYNCGS